SEPIYRRALAFWQQRGDLDEVAVSCNNLGAVCATLGRLSEAGELYAQAITIKRARLGSGHPDLAISLHNLAVLRIRLGERDDAIELLRMALEIFAQRLAPTHPHRQRCQARLDALLTTAADDA
ncbi:MAG: tetratricopeptide repeat protein, partial [Xanthomonadales bacterium]|nr:tetratricopeptide repeat protein [Xanthomonadales bacterium]